MKSKYPYIDMHCDTLLRCLVRGDGDLYDTPETMVDLSRMAQAGQMAQFFAVFFPPQTPEHPFDEWEFFEKLSGYLAAAMKEHGDVAAPAYSAGDIRNNHRAGKVSAVLTVEDGRAVNGDADKVRYFYDCGVRVMGYTWNFANCLGYPNARDPADMALGLTAFGKQTVEQLNELGVVIDVSHLSDGGFYDVAALTRKPFLATHSNCRALRDHPRNLTDEMLRLLADKGGAAGLNFCPEFVSDDPKHTTLAGLTAHVMHMLRVGGEDLPALGTDFDGIGGDLAVGQPTEMVRLFEALEQAGMTQRQLEKFARDNVLRVLEENGL